jgi:hypothetical protein
MDPIPHYSWIWPDSHPVSNDSCVSGYDPEYDEQLSQLIFARKSATNPETIPELTSFETCYFMELFANKWGLGLAIGVYNLIVNGWPIALFLFVVFIILGHCTAWFNITPRALKIINAKQGESVSEAVNRRINSIHSNK